MLYLEINSIIFIHYYHTDHCLQQLPKYFLLSLNLESKGVVASLYESAPFFIL